MEDCDGGESEGDDRIYVFSTTNIVNNRFAYKRHGRLRDQKSTPWVAVNPYDGLMYSSDFDTNQVNGYAPVFTSGSKLVPTRRIVLDQTLNGIQGGTFDPDGFMYLSVDGSKPGIYVFRIRGNHATLARFIHPNGYSRASHEEMEGLTWWDLDSDSRKAPGIEGGQIHWLLLDNDANDDDFFGKHIRVW